MLRRLVRTASSKRGALIDDVYYVQVRYPHGRQWVTVAIADSRARASTIASQVFPGLLDAGGETPRQCRIVSSAQLVREGGEREVRLADGEIARRPDLPGMP